MAEPKRFKNWKAITLCFIGATTFWFFSALGKDYSYRIKHPIEFVFDTDSLVSVQPLPQYVDVDVTGGGWDLFKKSFWFGSDPIIFELENPAAIRFLTRATILPIITDQLNQFRVNFLFTDTLYIDIDRKSSKWITLDVDSTRINLEEGYRIISPISFSPDTATIYGPSSFLDSISLPYFIPIDETEIDENFSSAVTLGLPDGFDIYADPQEITVTFEVEQFLTKQVETEVELINFPNDSTVFVSDPMVTVAYVIQKSKEKELDASDFQVVVDYDMIIKADSTVPAFIIVQPEHTLEVSLKPDTLAIHYAE